MSTIYQNSENVFLKIIDKYDIILNDDYIEIKEIYYNNINKNNNFIYYFDLFENYNNLKNDINIIYYIVILYYIEKNLLKNFIRFFTSKLLNYNFSTQLKIINYNELTKLNKNELIKYLKELIDKDKKVFYFFILTFQIYF